jgi:hypothetical protein
LAALLDDPMIETRSEKASRGTFKGVGGLWVRRPAARVASHWWRDRHVRRADVTFARQEQQLQRGQHRRRGRAKLWERLHRYMSFGDGLFVDSSRPLLRRLNERVWLPFDSIRVRGEGLHEAVVQLLCSCFALRVFDGSHLDTSLHCILGRASCWDAGGGWSVLEHRGWCCEDVVEAMATAE